MFSSNKANLVFFFQTWWVKYSCSFGEGFQALFEFRPLKLLILNGDFYISKCISLKWLYFFSNWTSLNEALRKATYIFNRIPSKSVSKTHPGLWTGRKLNLNHFWVEHTQLKLKYITRKSTKKKRKRKRHKND